MELPSLVRTVGKNMKAAEMLLESDEVGVSWKVSELVYECEGLVNSSVFKNSVQVLCAMSGVDKIRAGLSLSRKRDRSGPLEVEFLCVKRISLDE